MDPRLGSHSHCLRLVSELLAQTRLHPSPVKDGFQKQVERVARPGGHRAEQGEDTHTSAAYLTKEASSVLVVCILYERTS